LIYSIRIYMQLKNYIVFLLFLPLITSGQSIKLINSTSQSWSGGIAGRHGVNYSFEIEFSNIKKDINPDTIWIDHRAIPIILTETNLSENVNTRKIRKKDSVRFEIHTGTSYDDYEYRNQLPGDEKKKKEVNPPIPYKGVALLSYKYKGKEKYFVIDKIMKSMTPLNYP
jgi:hypothetical protein